MTDVVTDDGVHAGQKCPTIARPRYRGLLVEDIGAASADQGPDENSDPCYRDYDRLGEEQPPQLVRMHGQERKLEDPEDEKGAQGRIVDALPRWNARGQSQKRRPDGPYHCADRICAVHSLDREPEGGQDSARDNGDV